MKRLLIIIIAVAAIANVLVAGPVPLVGLIWLENFNPTTGAGVNAPLNQLLIRTDQPSIWYKSGAANTAWTELGSPGGSGGTVTSVACGAGILCSPSPIIGAGSVTLNITPTTCPAGQAEITTAADGTSTCAAFTPAALINVTDGHVPYSHPSGSLIDTLITFNPVTPAGTPPLTATGTLAAPVRATNLSGGEPAGNPTYTTTAQSAFGQRLSAATNVITLTTAGDAIWFQIGATLFASPNADGSSPRTGSTTIAATNTVTGTVTLTNAAAISGFSNNDYLFEVGLVNGAVSYAYYENDTNPALSTGLSPPSASVTGAGMRMRTQFGQVRRGMTSRVGCRTKSGGSTYYAVHNFGGGTDFFDTMWIDNIPDSSLVTLCPTVDTSAVYGTEIGNDAVHWMRTHPSVVGPADFSSLTSDPLVTGTYSLDNYGTGVFRTINGPNMELLKTGRSGGGLLIGYTTGSGLDTGPGYDPGNSLTRIFLVGDDGTLLITPSQPLIDSGLNLSTIDRTLINASGTLPAVSTAANAGVSFFVTSAGSSAFEQYGMTSALAAGYGGSSATKAIVATNNIAGSGLVYGVSAVANGAGTGTDIGLFGLGTGATHSIGVYASLGGAVGGRDAALVVDNAATGGDLIRSYNNGVLVFQELGNGTLLTPSVYIDGNGIQNGYNTNATNEINMNFAGYQAGATQFRNLRIFDGKNNLIVTVTGSTKTTTHAGPMSSTGTQPTVTVCSGTGFSQTGGAWKGKITAATGATSCVLTFAANIVSCTVSDETLPVTYSISGAALTVNSASLGASNVHYDCAL